MKPSPTLIEQLDHIGRVETIGQIRQICSQMLLAIARKEMSATDALAAAKMTDAIAHTVDSEVKVVRAAVELRSKGADIGKIAHIGQMLIGDGGAPSDRTSAH